MKTMKRTAVLLSLLVVALIFGMAQVSVSEVTQFDNAYWASFKPEVQALRKMEPFSPEREQKAIELALAGAVIDRNLHAIGATSPYYEMKLREKYGYTWVPSLLQAPGIGTDHPAFMMPPGVNAPGIQPYPVNAPSGAVKVSTKLEDYPPYAAPNPGEVVVDKTIVGAYNVGTYYHAGPGDSKDIPAGTIVTEPRGKFVKKVFFNPFGGSVVWEKIG